MANLGDRLQHAWNAFMNKDPTSRSAYYGNGYISTTRPDRVRYSRGNERSIITAIFNRIAIDCATVSIEHVGLDDNKRFVSDIDSGLNYCLSVEANKDQSSRAFMQDVVASMLDEGCVAIVPTDVDYDPIDHSVDILTLRVGKILEWYPDMVRVRVYNENTGYSEDIMQQKRNICIIENPLYSVVNEPNSTVQRLIRKLNLLDAIDEQSGSGKLNLIIQLPYTVKTEARRQQAEERRKNIEMQLAGNQYGIAYTDATEHITQLNRSADNNLMSQIEYLTSMVYSQLGITQEILNGTADEKAMLNYTSRTIEPIISAIVDEMKRKFLTKEARAQKQSVVFFTDPFKLVPANELAEIADKFTRNEILSSNEVRQIVGLKPVQDPKADELRNKNLNVADGQTFASTKDDDPDASNNKQEEIQNGV